MCVLATSDLCLLQTHPFFTVEISGWIQGVRKHLPKVFIDRYKSRVSCALRKDGRQDSLRVKIKQISNQCLAVKQALSDTGDLELHNKVSRRLAKLLRGESGQVLQTWTQYNTLASFIGQVFLLKYCITYYMLQTGCFTSFVTTHIYSVTTHTFF